MVILLGSLQLGVLYGMLALGIYITFRIMNVPDLTAEGSFTLGLALSAVMAIAGHPLLGLIVALLAGAIAGAVTGLLHTKLGIHPILAGILTMSGLYSVNLMTMGNSSNLSLINCTTVFKMAGNLLPFLDKDIVKLLVALVFTALCAILLILFFKTHVGLCIRATGDNEDMVRASSIHVDNTKILALALSNAIIAFTGALIAQYQSFADINSGVGILVVGLASVIIGEVLLNRRTLTGNLLAVLLGAIIYRFIIALATKYTILPAYMLKLVSACIVALALSLPTIKKALAMQTARKEAQNLAAAETDL
ncbi:MAG: ABC transporter permease [Peptococcaceae bacterium]